MVGDVGLPQIKNSDIVEHVLRTMINISSRKTTEGYAVLTMDTLIKKLGEEYDFLRYVEVKDTRFLEDTSSISVLSDMDSVSPVEIGKALAALIATMNRSLGKNAGHFFIKEIQSNLEDDYYSTIMDMGVDLSLMQLEHEVSEWEKMI